MPIERDIDLAAVRLNSGRCAGDPATLDLGRICASLVSALRAVPRRVSTRRHGAAKFSSHRYDNSRPALWTWWRHEIGGRSFEPLKPDPIATSTVRGQHLFRRVNGGFIRRGLQASQFAWSGYKDRPPTWTRYYNERIASSRSYL